MTELFSNDNQTCALTHIWVMKTEQQNDIYLVSMDENIADLRTV